jgi:hypothetical protein
MGEGAWRFGILGIGLALAAALGLCTFRGCGGDRPAPVVDRFQPSRPTPPGALADAVRRSADRRGGGSATPAPRATDSVRDPGRLDERRNRVELQPASLLPPEPVVVVPEALSSEQRDTIERYLSLLARLNLELAGAETSRSPAAVQRVSPVVDDLRGTLDSLLNLTQGQRLTVEREYGVRQRGLESELVARLQALRADSGMGPLVNLVEDVPGLD